MTRSLPAALSPVVAALELDQIELVDTSTLTDLIEQTGVETPINVVVQRLSGRGWLLPTGVRGVYEFAPGSHAGPFGREIPSPVSGRNCW